MGSNKRYPLDVRGPDGRQRHVWVLATRTARGPWPGLVLEWRRTGRDWEARVIYVPKHNAPESVQAWFPASMLRPIDSWPTEQVREAAKNAGQQVI